MKRLMGLDYGTKTVGVAISDSLGLLAHATETIHRKSPNKLRRTMARIEELAKENAVELIVLGEPLHMSGLQGERVKDTLVFRDLLEKRLNIPVIMWDERLTTIEAKELLYQQQVKDSDHKKYVDQIAAAFILQSYMDNTKH